MPHNDWDNSLQLAVVILHEVITGMTYKNAAGIRYEAHRNDRAIVKNCHKELAEMDKDRLLKKGLSVSIEPPR